MSAPTPPMPTWAHVALWIFFFIFVAPLVATLLIFFGAGAIALIVLIFAHVWGWK